MNKLKKAAWLGLVIPAATLFLQACVPVVATGAATGASVAYDRRTTGSVIDDQGIEFKAENEKHVMTVFTDYSCGYCQKLHREVEELNDAGITVRYLAWPRQGLNTPNYDNMVAIWCSDDPQQALNRAKSISNPTFPKADCDNTVAEQFVAGRQLGIRGTPAIIFDDGTMLPGYKPAAELIAQFARSE